MANEIKIAMIKKEITIDQLAKLLGISKSSLYRKMHGKTAFKMPEAKRIVEILGVSPSIFFR